MEGSIYLNALNQQFLKYLERLKEQLLAYSDEQLIWKIDEGR